MTRRGQTPAPTTRTLTGLPAFAACFFMLAIVVALFAVGVAIFTFILNVVIYNIFGLIDAPLDLWQGAAIWTLLWLVGGVFRR